LCWSPGRIRKDSKVRRITKRLSSDSDCKRASFSRQCTRAAVLGCTGNGAPIVVLLVYLHVTEKGYLCTLSSVLRCTARGPSRAGAKAGGGHARGLRGTSSSWKPSLAPGASVATTMIATAHGSGRRPRLLRSRGAARESALQRCGRRGGQRGARAPSRRARCYWPLLATASCAAPQLLDKRLLPVGAVAARWAIAGHC
jgi:hypothetical protein